VSRATLAGDAPPDIITMTRFPMDPLAPACIVASELGAKQREMLMAIVDA